MLPDKGPEPEKKVLSIKQRNQAGHKQPNQAGRKQRNQAEQSS
jgi:hypothetical protein